MNARATTVVALATPRGIILAGDSRIITIDGKRSDSICKIRSEGDLYFTTAGLFASRLAGFNAWDIMRNIARTSDTGRLSDIMTRFNVETASALFQERGAVEQALKVNVNFNLAETMVLRSEGGVVRVLFSQTDISNGLRHLTPEGARNLSFNRQTQSMIGGTGQQLEMLAIGMRDHILHYQSLHPDWTNMDAVSVARMFVQLEIAAHPELVGPPVAILEIKRDGSSNWIDRGVCGS